MKGRRHQPSAQRMLNDGGERSCHGDSVDDARQRLMRVSVTDTCISHETSQAYMPRFSQAKKDLKRSRSWRTAWPKDALMLPSLVNGGEPTEEDKKRTPEALTAVSSGRGSTKMGTSAAYVCRQMGKPRVKNGLSEGCFVLLSYAIRRRTELSRAACH